MFSFHDKGLIEVLGTTTHAHTQVVKLRQLSPEVTGLTWLVCLEFMFTYHNTNMSPVKTVVSMVLCSIAM